MNNLETKLESLLFVAGKPLTAKQLANMLEVEAEKVVESLNTMREARKESGVVLLESNGTWQMGTNSKNSPEVKNFLNLELREKLTDATLETLAIIAYRQPISRSEIEAIRGVNCQYAIRHLLIRGMIQKIPKDSRQILYETTIEFLQQMGLSSLQDLPEFEKLVEKIKLPANIAPQTETPPSPESGEEMSDASNAQV